MIDLPTPERQRAYLLGRASEADAEAIETALFTDPAAHDALLAIEGDLVDAFVTETLAPAERAAFEARLRGDARLRHRVGVVRGLVERARTPASAPTPTQAARAWWRGLRGSRGPVLGLAMAAVAAVVVVAPQVTAPPDGAFRAKGGAEAVFRPRCLPACRLGAKLTFELTPPDARPFVAAFGRRPDGRIVWYEPRAGRETRRMPEDADFWPRTFTLGAEHLAGPHDVYAAFFSTPMTRDDVAEAVGDDLAGSEDVVLVRRQIRIEGAR